MLVKVLAVLLALFAAYVVGRAAGILLGIGPYLTEAAAVLIVLAVVVRRSLTARRRDGKLRGGHR